MSAPKAKSVRALLVLVLLLAVPCLSGEAWGLPSQTEETQTDEPSTQRVYRGGQVGIFTAINVPANEVHRGDLVCIGCDAVIEGEVTRDVVVIGGSLTLSGKAGHDVVCVLSNVELKEGAEIGHDFVNVLGSLEDAGAIVHRERVNIPVFFGLPSFKGAFGVLGAIIAWAKVLKLVLLFVVLLILAGLVPERIRTVSDEVPLSLGMAYLAGLGGYLALWVVNSLLFISVIGFPVAILIFLLFGVLKTLGLAGIFHYVGRRLGQTFNREMSLLGGILLGFVLFALILVLPHFFGLMGIIVAIGIRLLFWLLIELPAVGLIILTRVGGKPRSSVSLAEPSAQMVPQAPHPPPSPSTPPPAAPPP